MEHHVGRRDPVVESEDDLSVRDGLELEVPGTATQREPARRASARHAQERFLDPTPDLALEKRREAEGLATRREESGLATGREESGLATRREESGLATRREDGRHGAPSDDGHSTRREDVLEEPDVVIGLPAALRARYTVQSEMPDPGAEADVLLVTDRQTPPGEDARRVIKIYRQGIHAERSVWEKVRSMSSQHVVRVLETGSAAGRDYEVMEYLAGGNLTALVPRRGIGVPVPLVHDVVRQVTAGLVELHAKRIVHRDLKPENVLIRRSDPLELVVTDFGLSRVHETSMVAASRSGTMAYLAPEILLSTGAVSSPARDWWALGIMVRELVTGERPFEEMTAKGIDRALMLRGVDLGAVEDSRLRLLCRGLLVRDPEDRWGAAHVQEWLAGGSPEVLDETASSADDLKPFLFENVAYREKKALARAFLRSWDKATRRYFVAMGTDADSSEGWRALRTWLQQFSNPEIDDVESLVELIDERLKPSGIPPDAKMLALLRWLDPNLPAVYRGQAVTREHLPALAATAAFGEGQDQSAAARVVQDLFSTDLLKDLSTMPGGDGLADVDRRWRELTERYDEHLRQVAMRLPPPAHAELGKAGARRLAGLLMLALEPQASQRLGHEVANRRQLLPMPVGWLDGLLAGQERNPVADVVALAAFPAAASEAEASATAQRQREEAARQRQELWNSREQQRVAVATAAVGRSWRYLGVALGVMGLLFLLEAGGRDLSVNLASLGVGVAVGAYLVLSETAFAQQLGADYDRFTAMAAAGSSLRRFGQGMRYGGAGRGLLMIFLGIFALWVAVAVPLVAYGALAAHHAVNLRRRRASWQGVYQAERSAALGAA